MFRLDASAHLDSVLAMAATGGGFYGKAKRGGWVTGKKRELTEAKATDIKRANVRVERTYL
jgi:hypothetical protein